MWSGSKTTSDGVLSDGVLSDGTLSDGSINGNISFTLGKSLVASFEFVLYDTQDPKSITICSVYELEEFFSWFDSYKLKNYETELDREIFRKDLIKIEAEITDIKSNYDNEFFEENALLLYGKGFGNCNANSIPVINSVVRDSNKVSINAIRSVTPAMNAALESWAGFIEVKKDDIKGVENVELNVVELLPEGITTSEDIQFTLGKSFDTSFKYSTWINNEASILVHSVKELEELIALTNLDKIEDSTELAQVQAEINDVKNTYDNDFFEENVLIYYGKVFRYYYAPATINSVRRVYYSINLEATRKAAFKEGEQNWAGFIELKKESIENIDNVEFNIPDVSSADVPFTQGKSLDLYYSYYGYKLQNNNVISMLISSAQDFEKVFSLVDLNKIEKVELTKIEEEINNIKSYYNDDFFKENSLIFYGKVFGDSYSVPEIDSSFRKTHTVFIRATRKAVFSDAKQPWAGFIEVKKADVEGVENVELNVVEVFSKTASNGY